MSSSEIDSLTDRLVSRIFTSDYPGTYKLSTTTPTGGGWGVDISNVFTDNRIGGGGTPATAINYNLYRRTSMAAPTENRPLSIKRSSGTTGTYQGLQEMSDAQIQYTFGQRAKTRIMDGSQNVGSYLLLSSTQGSPNALGYTGTWTAKGNATDSRQQVSTDTAYTRISTRIRNSNYTRISVGNYSRNFAGNYSRTTSTRNSILISTRDSTGNYIGNYSRSFSRNFVGADSTRDRTSSYAGAFASR
jgi:hypothetical protein